MAGTIESITLKLTPEIGAELPGLDLSGTIEETIRADILDALYQHQLLLFRGQRLTPEQQVAFSRCFGQVETHPPESSHPEYPEVVVVSGTEKSGTHYWHTDRLVQREPSSVSLLYPRQLPSHGGDTLFVNAYTAYETLPEELKRRIEGRRMVYGPSDGVAHPMVRTHPVTGRKALYVDLMVYLRRIAGMGSREKESLIRELIAHVERSVTVYCHRWHYGDLLVWDNAAVLHRAGPADSTEARVLHRTTVCGTVPY